MTNTDHTKITSLIEQRIRDEVQHEGRKAVNAFEAVIDAELAKMGVSTFDTCKHRFVFEVRTTHLDNLVNKRIDALVEQLVLDPRKEAAREQDLYGQVVKQVFAASTRASYESARKLASPPVGSEVHAVHHGLNSSMPPASEMPPVPALDAEGLTLILARILAQLEIQTAIMADNAKKAERDSKLYQDTLTVHTREKKVAAQAESATATATAFQLGDKVMLKSGGPVMTVVVVMENGSLMCGWMNGDAVNRAPFLPVCLSRASDQTSHGSIRV